MVTIDEVKNSLRIDHTFDDDMLFNLIETAKQYVISAIDSTATDDEISMYKQFEWSVSLLAQHWYLNRQEASSEHIPVTVLSMIQQMRGTYYATH